MVKITFAGAPSTGKTSLAQGLAFNLKKEDKYGQIELVTEFARDFVQDFRDPPTPSDELHILNEQLKRETKANNSDILITDSPLWSSLIYATHQTVPFLSEKNFYYINKIHEKLFENNIFRYTQIIYIPFTKEVYDKINADDEKRVHIEEEQIRIIDKKIRGFMDYLNLDYYELKRTEINERIQECMDHLETKINRKMEVIAKGSR